jgi:hypothetical protein
MLCTHHHLVVTWLCMHRRAVSLLPRIDQLWYKYIHMEEMVKETAKARLIFDRWMAFEPDHAAWMAYIKVSRGLLGLPEGIMRLVHAYKCLRQVAETLPNATSRTTQRGWRTSRWVQRPASYHVGMLARQQCLMQLVQGLTPWLKMPLTSCM